MIPVAKPIIGAEEIESVRTVMESGMLAQGKQVKLFEEQFAEFIGVKHAVAVVNGTVALDLALKALGINAGDEVIVPAFTFIATANSVLFQGAKPVFVDVDQRTFTLDIEDVEKKISNKTRAIIPVHLFGQAADMKALSEVVDGKKISIIEDCAQAHGEKFDGRRVGSFDIGSFSFYPTKNMTTGEGGMITTNDETVAKRAKLLRDHGQSEKYLHTEVGYNYRLTDIGAAIGIAQLKKLNGWNDVRRKNAEYLNNGIKAGGIIKPYKANYSEHVYHQYVIRITSECRLSRDQFKQELEKLGIGTGVHYPISVHHQPVYKNLGYGNEKHIVSEIVAKEVLSLPVHPSLSEKELSFIATGVSDIAGGK
ncbi:DegT/DnrJ/EryC1/StrS family aminotransferase [Candidatus Micrarchaeota archaeon]|nr:DegT/DnrJ/EryC1/StrS family aminotransferase [Candidatus Micrarchaeota archaeon]